MFDNLSDKLQRVFKNLRGEGKLTAENMDAALREIRVALLEADVHFRVVKQLIESIKLKAQGEEVPFDVEVFRKYCLLNGLDDIGLTLRQSDKIKAFEAERLATKPWLNHTVAA